MISIIIFLHVRLNDDECEQYDYECSDERYYYIKIAS